MTKKPKSLIVKKAPCSWKMVWKLCMSPSACRRELPMQGSSDTLLLIRKTVWLCWNDGDWALCLSVYTNIYSLHYVIKLNSKLFQFIFSLEELTERQNVSFLWNCNGFGEWLNTIAIHTFKYLSILGSTAWVILSLICLHLTLFLGPNISGQIQFYSWKVLNSTIYINEYYKHWF